MEEGTRFPSYCDEQDLWKQWTEFACKCQECHSNSLPQPEGNVDLAKEVGKDNLQCGVGLQEKETR